MVLQSDDKTGRKKAQIALQKFDKVTCRVSKAQTMMDVGQITQSCTCLCIAVVCLGWGGNPPGLCKAHEDVPHRW